MAVLAELSKSCLFYLAFHILGYKDLDANLHWSMASQWQENERHKLFLYPRGTFKTTMLTISGAIFEILNNPNIRILISNANLENSKTILKGIKDHFMFNERFRGMFPEFCPRLNQRKTVEFGTQLDFSVPNRDIAIKESTVEVGSVEGNLVSRHYDLHIGDDLVSDKNTTTKDQIDKVDSFRQGVYCLLEPGTSRDILIGTCWHWDDIYARIMNDKESPYKVYRRQIWEPDAEGNLKSIFPKRFPIKVIKEIRKKQSAVLFSCQYLNLPIADEDAMFKKDWINFYDLPKDKEDLADFIDHLYRITTIDPAASETNRADFSAIVTIGVGPDDETYVLETKRGRWNPGQLIDQIFRTFLKLKPNKIGIESFAFQKVLKWFIREEMRRRRTPLPIQELDRESMRSKTARIESLQPRVEHCPFKVTRDMIDLIDEMIRYPKAKNDDLLDALAYSEQLRRTPPRRQVPDSLAGMRFGDLIKKLDEKKRQGRRIGGHRLSYA